MSWRVASCSSVHSVGLVTETTWLCPATRSHSVHAGAQDGSELAEQDDQQACVSSVARLFSSNARMPNTTPKTFTRCDSSDSEKGVPNPYPNYHNKHLLRRQNYREFSRLARSLPDRSSVVGGLILHRRSASCQSLNEEEVSGQTSAQGNSHMHYFQSESLSHDRSTDTFRSRRGRSPQEEVSERQIIDNPWLQRTGNPVATAVGLHAGTPVSARPGGHALGESRGKLYDTSAKYA